MNVRVWLRPDWSPTPLRFDTTAAEILADFGSPTDAGVVDALLAEAEDIYAEAGERSESAERRASTIQGSIAIATGLTFAGGSVLLDTSKIRAGWAWPLGLCFAGAILCLAVAAWRAFLVTWPKYLWATPASTDIYSHALEPDARAIKLRRTADLLVAYGRNDRIAAVKVELLGSAVRWLISALALVAVLAALLAADAITAPSTDGSVDACGPQAVQRSSARGSTPRQPKSPGAAAPAAVCPPP